MAADHELGALAVTHGSDKWGPHSYTRHYEAQFQRFRDRDIALFEIGVGGYDDPALGGGSLRMWADYFPKAAIHALDLHEKHLQIDRVQIHQGSQTDAGLLRAISAEAGGFDIVIDDGSHLNADVIQSFEALFPLLKTGGLYVVEDVQTSYWPRLGGSSAHPDRTRTIMGYFKGLIHGINHAEISPAHYRHKPYDTEILSIAFYHNLIFVQKDDNSEPSNIPPDDPLREDDEPDAIE